MKKVILMLLAAMLALSGAAFAWDFEMEAPQDEMLRPRYSYDPKKPMLALTFENGPGPATRRILAALAQAGGRATFFVATDRAGQYDAALREIQSQGSEIGACPWTQAKLPKLTKAQMRDEIGKSLNAIEGVTGVRPSALRPPNSESSEDLRDVCGELGLVIVNWSVDTLDASSKNPDSIFFELMTHVCDGAIVYCTDLYDATAEGMERSIPELVKMGYQLVTVTELLDARDAGWEAGQVYYGDR